MKKIVHPLNCLVFAASTVTIMGIVYEGFAIKWFAVVGVLILITDGLFMLSTLVNLVVCRKSKVMLSFSMVSLILIVIAFAMMALKIEYPVITLVLWNFYIWFYYGGMVSQKLWSKK